MAYYTTIFQDAHKDPTLRNAVPEQTTYGSLANYAKTPHASIPLSRSPQSRPFAVFANSPPTPPPSRLGPPMPPSAAELAEKASMARQRALYAMPGAPPQPDFRRWNGRVICGPVSPKEKEDKAQEQGQEDKGQDETTSSSPVVVESLVNTARVVLDAVKVQLRRQGSAHARRWSQLLFHVSALRYNLARSPRTAAVNGLLSLVAVFLFVVWQLGRVVVADWCEDWDGELLHLLME
ncbi:hypothetical protein F5Y03DRAFT_300969 [Xylaria venustula]|nr:hypothetical protein F5Y03DRAFT_300969 [Xylaria venustula]